MIRKSKPPVLTAEVIRLWNRRFCQRIKSFLLFEQNAVPRIFDHAVLLHFGKLIAHGAAVHIQIVRQLLAVVRDQEGTAPGPFGAFRKIGHQPPADGFGTGMQDPLGKLEALVGTDSQQISDKPCVKWTGIGTGGQDAARIQKQYGSILRSRHRNEQRLPRNAGIYFGEYGTGRSIP